MFECKGIRDKKLFKEIYFHILYKSGINLVLEIICGILFVLNIISVFCDDEPFYFFFYCYALIIVFKIWYYNRLVGICVAREKEHSFNGPIEYTTVIYDDRIVQKSSLGSDYTMLFSNIKKVFKTSHYIVLQSAAKQMFILEKEKFNVGDSEQLILFLREKGYKI